MDRYDNISGYWFLAGAATGILILITTAASIAYGVISLKEPKNFYKTAFFLALSSFILLLTDIVSVRLLQTRWPGNTINWRHDHAMEKLFINIFLVCAVLFIMTFAATITYLVAARKERKIEQGSALVKA